MKKENGSITIITLTTVLFMIAFLLSTYTIISNRRQAQVEIKKETAKIYEEDVERIDEMYDSYFASSDEEIPIYTAEQLFKIATGNTVAVDEKLYIFSKDSKYVLMNNITFDAEEYATKYSEAFEKTSAQIGIDTYVERTTWKNLTNILGENIDNFNYNNKIIVEQCKGFNNITYPLNK